MENGKPPRKRNDYTEQLYVDGRQFRKEVCITDAQKAEMEKNLESRDAWEARKKEIMRGA